MKRLQISRSAFYGGTGDRGRSCVVCGQWHGQSLIRPLITSRIEEDNLVTLRGNTRTEATALNDRGRLADSTPWAHVSSAPARSRTGAGARHHD